MARLKGQLFLRMFFTFLVYFFLGIVLYLLARWLYSRRIWQGTEFFYQIAHWLYLRQDLLAIAYLLIGFISIFLYYWSKPFVYLQEVTSAVDQIYRKEDDLIELSDPLKDVENRINQARVDMLNNERIAREAEQRKNDLITYLAHDLKTPITSVIGYLTLLRDEPQISPELRAKYTGIALDKAERLEDLINEFFDITRFNLSKLTLEPERLNLSRMLEQICYEFYPILSEKELRLRTDILPDVEILSDPEKLERVFDNLLRNAVNYSYARTDIFLSLRRFESIVEIRIQNHGKTIPPEKLNRIFEQFFRLDSSRSTSTGGAGLGLAISKEIVELHGGRIWAESANESIRFTVQLPVDCKKIV